MIRLFVGLALPPALAEQTLPMRSGLPGARWQAPEDLHLTLRNIGEVHERQATLIDASLAGIERPAFELTVSGCGIFTQRKGPEAVWIGAISTLALIDLQGAVERACVRAGLAPEDKRFRPHVTLATLEDIPAPRLQAYVASHNLFKQTVTIDSFALFSRMPGAELPQYRIEATYPLTGSGLGVDP